MPCNACHAAWITEKRGKVASIKGHVLEEDIRIKGNHSEYMGGYSSAGNNKLNVIGQMGCIWDQT